MAEMTDTEAMFALAEPMPEPNRQKRPSESDNEELQAWHKNYVAAMEHAQRRISDALEAQSGGYESDPALPDFPLEYMLTLRSIVADWMEEGFMSPPYPHRHAEIIKWLGLPQTPEHG